ncbi:unnamed protein product [Microthlaspi erraticum]|uniref:Uncharacterized protein n=1 Tax=Microthlaspi erraticum TaxID=1685480 RepID=A0A6D2LCG8_9BRAS|nr:unnamed protein product [Microthlaspi erraticum]
MLSGGFQTKNTGASESLSTSFVTPGSEISPGNTDAKPILGAKIKMTVDPPFSIKTTYSGAGDFQAPLSMSFKLKSKDTGASDSSEPRSVREDVTCDERYA